MKRYVIKFSFLIFFSLILIGCDKDETEDLSPTSSDSEATSLNAKVDTASEVISDTFLQAYENEENLLKGPKHLHLPDCVTLGVEVTDTSKVVQVDFGSEGCEVRGGHIVKGKVVLSYLKDTDTKTVVINYSFEDFFIDDMQFLGSKTVTRTKENDNGNPQYTMELNLTIAFADGGQATRIGSKTREWIEGAFNGNWGDNVFLITGEWETNFKNGDIHSAKITSPLRREASCRFLVSGIIEISKTNYNGTLDYGDGNCDNIATFTNDSGDQVEIKL